MLIRSMNRKKWKSKPLTAFRMIVVRHHAGKIPPGTIANARVTFTPNPVKQTGDGFSHLLV